jgi:hypothetical protein
MLSGRSSTASCAVPKKRACAPKSLQGQRISRELVRKKLRRNMPAQLQVFSFVHYAHAAAPEFLDDAVVRDGLPN